MIDTLINLASSLWQFDPLRWLVILWVSAAILFVIAMKAKRWATEDEHVSTFEKIVTAPVMIPAAIGSWLTNWTLGTIVWRALPHTWDQTFTKRLQFTLDHPRLHTVGQLWLARKLRPFLNRHDPGHLE